MEIRKNTQSIVRMRHRMLLVPLLFVCLSTTVELSAFAMRPAVEPDHKDSMDAALPQIQKQVAINEADVKAFQTLQGIGVQLSERIVRYREEHGPFGSLEDLARVKGVSARMVEQNRDMLTM